MLGSIFFFFVWNFKKKDEKQLHICKSSEQRHDILTLFFCQRKKSYACKRRAPNTCSSCSLVRKFQRACNMRALCNFCWQLYMLFLGRGVDLCAVAVRTTHFRKQLELICISLLDPSFPFFCNTHILKQISEQLFLLLQI